MQKLLEIACFNIESAITAQAAGANRIELCENYKEGGITPDENLILEARKQIHIPLHVIIRPRGGNFIYSTSEIQEMNKSILFCKQNRIDGVVFGILNKESKIDNTSCAEMIALAKPMHITFHRAIDECRDIKKEIQNLIDLGCNSVLSSGGRSSALEGVSLLKELRSDFGSKINIIPGGGIRSGNILQIIEIAKCNVFHSAALVKDSDIVSTDEIKALKNILSQC